MKTAIFALAAVLVLLVSGCTTQQGETGTQAGDYEAASDVGSDISSVDEIGNELNLSELEGMSSQLDDLNW